MGRGMVAGIAAVLAIPLFIVVVLAGGPDCTTTGSATAVQAAVAALPEEGLEDLPGLSTDPAVRAEQLGNAVLIINAAKDVNLPLKAQVIGVMTAMGESSLINLDHGDEGDGVTNPDGTPTCSLGLFQQQWCLGWGTREQVTDPTYAAGKFYERLAEVTGWQDLEPTIAAHRVQRNADPWHYERYWPAATAVVGALTGVSIDPAATVQAGQCAYAAAGGTGNYTEGAAGPWGGYSNGLIPTEVLKPLPWDPSELLRPDATDALTALNNAHRAQFGTNLIVTDTYRTYAEQVAVKAAKPDLAATPGTSNHGWALAVDFGGMGIHSTTTYQWMAVNAPRYGWINPEWAQAGGSKPEAWHWEYVGGPRDA
jgi:hypothetical protein